MGLKVPNKDDGMWEFYGVEDLKDDDYRVVSLGKILELDASISDLQSMLPGKYASRNTKNEPWTIFDIISD